MDVAGTSNTVYNQGWEATALVLNVTFHDLGMRTSEGKLAFAIFSHC